MSQAEDLQPQARNMSSAAESPKMLSLEEASAVQLLSDSNCMAQSICQHAMRARQAMRVAQLSVPHKSQVFSIAQSLLDHHGPGDICPLGTQLPNSPLCPINGPLKKCSAWRLSMLLHPAQQVLQKAVPPARAEGKAEARLVGVQTLWVLALMRDCQPPGQGEALLICRFSSSISCAKMPARLRAARRLSLLLYE